MLRRPKLRRYAIEDEHVQSVLVVLAPFLPTVDLEVEIRDPDGAPVVRAAVAGRADAIGTGDSDLLEDRALRRWLERRGIALYTPSGLLELL